MTGTPPNGANVTPTAANVNVVLPELSGKVTAMAGGTITLTDSQGFWRTVKASAKTTYTRSGESGDASDVTVGSQITAVGSVDADHTDLDASRINVVLPSLSGKVTAISGGMITLQPFGGRSQTVDTTASTTFSDGGTAGSLGDVSVGDFISATGTHGSNGSFRAIEVSVYGGGAGHAFSGGHQGPGNSSHGWGANVTPSPATP
jgi:hypothetical protein